MVSDGWQKSLSRITYGDWQTNMDLATKACRVLRDKGCRPSVIIEPTCGLGNFILAALDVFHDSVEMVICIDINPDYIRHVQSVLENVRFGNIEKHFVCKSIFDVQFSELPEWGDREVLAIGNPPWVTNSQLGAIEGDNIPLKSNFKNLRGIDAMTGGGNFDIAESVLLHLFRLLAHAKANFAFLVKTSVARCIVRDRESSYAKSLNFCQYNFDAKREFGVSVSACLFIALRRQGKFVSECKVCEVNSLYGDNHVYPSYGWVGDCFTSDVTAYKASRLLEGECQLEWRSGIKHDCSQVMEMTDDGGVLRNASGQVVDVECDVVFPLVKGSALKGWVISQTNRFVLVPQKTASDDMADMPLTHPKSYNYLLANAALLDNRKSSIYRRRPRFSIFGIGEYSFKPYKVAVAGLYKNAQFSLVEPIYGKPVMLDDTCYMIGLDNRQAADVICRVLNGSRVQSFLKSIIFPDSKRTVCKSSLMRIDLCRALSLALADGVISQSEYDCAVAAMSCRGGLSR